MTREEVYESVRQITSDLFCVPLDDISGKTIFVTDLNADSLDAVELAMEFEHEFDISIEDKEAEVIVNVDQAVDALVTRIKEHRLQELQRWSNGIRKGQNAS